MFAFLKRKSFWFAVALIAISIAIKIPLTILLSCLLIQIVIIARFTIGLRDFIKTRKGDFVIGTVTAVNDITPVDSNNNNFERTITFSWPANSEHYLKRKLYSVENPGTGEKYRIWVNKANPEESLVMDETNHFLPMSLIYILGFAGISFAEWYIFLKQLTLSN